MRYWMSTGVHKIAGIGFPYGTLAVNVAGCWLIGLLYVWLVERSAAAPIHRAFLMIGVLGSFTTFSSFSVETLNLIETGEVVKAVLNILLSVCLCLGTCWLGMVSARAIGA